MKTSEVTSLVKYGQKLTQKMNTFMLNPRVIAGKYIFFKYSHVALAYHDPSYRGASKYA